MLKVYAFSAFMFFALGAAWDMPSTCFSSLIGRCYATQISAWATSYKLNWPSVDYTRRAP